MDFGTPAAATFSSSRDLDYQFRFKVIIRNGRNQGLVCLDEYQIHTLAFRVIPLYRGALTVSLYVVRISGSLNPYNFPKGPYAVLGSGWAQAITDNTNRDA